MRSFIVSLFVLGAFATAAEPVKIVQEHVDAVKPALDKALTEYRKKVTEENTRLTATLQRAMEKSTRAGKLEDALALKEALDLARSGELLKDYLLPATGGMLGDDPAGLGGMATVSVSVANPTAILVANAAVYDNRDYLISEVSKELQGLTFVQRSFKEPAPCTVSVIKGGVLYVAVGIPDAGLDLDKQGFTRTGFTVRCTTGELAIVQKTVKTGDSIRLAPTATTSSFPIWKAK